MNKGMMSGMAAVLVCIIACASFVTLLYLILPVSFSELLEHLAWLVSR